VFFLLDGSALQVISWVGGITSLMSALIAVQQNDIKRILAYSTLSQLGYMVMGVGLHGPTESMFHLTTHAFFKALLFLGAGSVIVGLHHEQDIWKMGDLRKRMPVTYWTFLVGTLALAGVVPLSGFYSKDAVLNLALEHQAYVRFGLGVVVAVLTSFYMFRLVFVVFGSKAKSEAASHGHESPPVMLFPLRALAVFSIIGGVIGVENVLGIQFEAAPALSTMQQIVAPFAQAPVAASLGLLAAAAGFFAAYRLYCGVAKDPLPTKLGPAAQWLSNRFYLDELYEATFIRMHDLLAAIADWIDRWLIAGVGVRGLHGTTEILGRVLREVQTGNLQTYAFLFAIGVALLLLFMLR
jgi:NADH-quinone oxidoreductase subunit L